MAFPQVQDVTQTQMGAATSHDVNMPGTVNAGELLIILFTVSDETPGVNEITTPTEQGDWTELYKLDSGDVNYSSGAAYVKVADGDEAGQTVDIVTSVSQAACAQVYRISNWFGILAGVERTKGGVVQSAIHNPPSLNPGAWDVEDTLWLAIVHAGDDDATVNAYPTNYTDGVDTASGAGGNAGCEIGSAQRENAIASENPEAFTLSETEQGFAATIGVRPAAGPAAGWTHIISGVANANLAEVSTTAKANIAYINQT